MNFKTNMVFLIVCTACIFSIMTSSKIDPKNPPVGQTGAPNETTCSTAIGCHNGGTYTGTVLLAGLPEKILPNTTYPLTHTLNSTCLKSGFEITVLNKNNSKCGDLIAGTNSNLKTSGSRQYARQSNAINLAGGKGSFSFSWKSPTTVIGDSVFLYYVMLQANNNGGTAGDNVAKGITKAILDLSSKTNDESLFTSLEIYPNPVSDYLTINVKTDEALAAELISASGKKIYSFSIQKSKVIDVKNLNEGLYYLKLQVKNKQIIKKFVVEN